MTTTLQFKSGPNTVRKMLKEEFNLISFKEESIHLSIDGKAIEKDKFMETLNLIIDCDQDVKLKVFVINVNLYPITIDIHTLHGGNKNYSIIVDKGVMIWGQNSEGNIAFEKGYKILNPGVNEYDTIFTALFSIFSETVPDPEKRRFLVNMILDNEIVIKQKKNFKAIQTEDGYCTIIE